MSNGFVLMLITPIGKRPTINFEPYPRMTAFETAKFLIYRPLTNTVKYSREPRVNSGREINPVMLKSSFSPAIASIFCALSRP